ncbi:25S rRNA (adenine645-N1)-methyltransferase [Mortierella sp. AD094]|nr:25S rRNA (adenine645-N1)-methyltransferase [Mortierella sp. AD094]
MFAIPGFNVGNLVVEAPKEQLKKRKHDAIATTTTTTTNVTAASPSTGAVKASATTASTTTTTTTTATTTTTTADSTLTPSSSLTIAPSTSNAPFSKKFKKEPVFEKRPPSEPKLGWGWIPEPVPLKERASWNRPTKALRKAKAEEEKAKKEKAIEDKKRTVSSISGPGAAVELLLQGSVDMADIAGLGGKKNKDKDGDDTVMAEAGSATQEPKKRNKRLERKIKRAAYIAALDSTTTSNTDGATEESKPVPVVVEAPEETTNEASEEVKVEGGESGKKIKKKKVLQAPAPVHPELAKLTNKEKRLLKQFQKKQEQEGVDLAAKALPELLKPAPKKVQEENKKPATTVTTTSESKKEKNKEKKATATTEATTSTPAAQEKKKDAKSNKKVDSEVSKKQQQLAKEREKLLEALNRTNSALAELQTSLGDGDEDDSPMTKADVKSAVQDEKEKKDKKKGKAAEPTPAPAAAKATPAAPVTQQKQPKLTKLQEQMKKTLAGGKFRFLNEQLYTTTGEEAFELFQSKPELFDEYHEGFRSQVELWPQNPVDIFLSELKKMPKDTVIADLGCGDAQISEELMKKQYKNVLSFDLVAKNERVTACDIAHLPLQDGSVDVAIFCLSLMGTDFLKFLKEAHRVLKPNGQLKIAEVISRFTDVDAFVSALKALGFELKHSDSSNKMFILFDFIKPDPNLANSKSKKSKKGNKKQKVEEETEDVDVEELDGSSLLKPCIYKKR